MTITTPIFAVYSVVVLIFSIFGQSNISEAEIHIQEVHIPTPPVPLPVPWSESSYAAECIANPLNPREGGVLKRKAAVSSSY